MSDAGILAALALLLLVVGVVVMLQRTRRHPRGGAGAGPGTSATGQDDAIDYRTLEQAEHEVRNIDDNGTGGPTDHTLGDDWGPGTPRPPHRL